MVEQELDQFGRLPDEVVLLIVNKLFHLKTLLRFSLVAKRYSSLASQTHTLVLDMDFSLARSTSPAAPTPPSGFVGRIGGFLNNLIFKLTSTSSRAAPSTDHINPEAEAEADADLSLTKFFAITHRFQQIRNLHLHLRGRGGHRDSPFCTSTSYCGLFSSWVTVFGSHLEQIHFLAAASANPNSNLGSESSSGLTSSLEYWSELFETILSTASVKHAVISGLVSKCKMIEAVAFSDSFGGILLMGKRQIAKLREANQLEEPSSSSLSAAHHDHYNHPAPAQLRAVVYAAATLELPKTGYTLKDAIFASAMLSDEDAANVKIGDGDGSDPKDFDFDSEKWDVFTEAVGLIHGENWEKMYDSLHPYQQLLPNRI